MTEKTFVKLSGSYSICAAHRLFNQAWTEEKNRKIFGHCYDLHGHEYKIIITITGSLDPETGMIINGYELDDIVKDKIFQQIDHKYLNEDVDFFKKYPPTAEWISVWVYREIQSVLPHHVQLDSVRVYETPDLYAEYQEK